MDRYQQIYRDRADDYDRLVSAEDCDRQLPLALARRASPGGRTVVEVGAGTGRVTALLLDAGARVIATEPAAAMIGVARHKLGHSRHLLLARASAWQLPVADGAADLAIAGWVIGHFRAWFPADWRARCAAAIAEMARVVAPGGRLVVIESLGTAREQAGPPSAELAELHAELERTHGMERDVIRTDYRFGDVDTAAAVLGEFFGSEMAATVRRAGWSRVPEWTGLWWR